MRGIDKVHSRLTISTIIRFLGYRRKEVLSDSVRRRAFLSGLCPLYQAFVEYIHSLHVQHASRRGGYPPNDMEYLIRFSDISTPFFFFEVTCRLSR